MPLYLEVGILDADIYGPSLPSLLPTSVAEKVYGSEGGGGNDLGDGEEVARCWEARYRKLNMLEGVNIYIYDHICNILCNAQLS